MTPLDPKKLAFRVLGEPFYERLRALHMARKIRDGRYRDAEVDLVERFVAPGDSTIDMGANFGLYSYHLARRVGPAGCVYAFEAAPGTALALRRVMATLRVADRVRVIEKAVGDGAGTVTLDVPRRPDGSTDAGRSTVADGGSASGVEVPLTRVDDEVPSSEAVTFIKVDVEGADLAALRGASRLIARHAPTLIVEVSPLLLSEHGQTPADVGEFLSEHGYATYAYDPEARRLEPFDARDASGDIVAVHPQRSGALGSLTE